MESEALLKFAGKAPAARRNVNAVALAIAGLLCLGLMLLLIRGAVATPFSDEFYFHELYQSAKQGTIDFNEIMRPHFGHVYVLLKSWLWMVVHFNMDWRVSMYVGAVFIAMSSLLVARYALQRSRPHLKLVVALAAAFSVASMRQSENVYWAMQLSGAVMIFFSIAAFYAVAKFAETQAVAHAVLAFALGLLSFMSTGGGLMSFSITIFAIFVVSNNNRVRISAVVVGMLFIIVVMSYMRSALQGQLLPSLLNAKNFAVYVLAFFANTLYTFSAKADDASTIVLGAIILACTAYTVKVSWNDRKQHIFAYMLIAFALASCFAIAYARLKNGIWQPHAPRYYPSAVAILVGNLLIWGQSKNSKHAPLALLLCLLISASFAQSYFSEWRLAPFRYIAQHNAHTSLCSGSSSGLAFWGDMKATDRGVMRSVFCSNSDVDESTIRSQPIMLEFGPTQTTRHMPFNQVDGVSSIWIRTENCQQACKLMFADVELPVISVNNGTLLAAGIPKELYETAGEKVVYIKNTNSGKRSGSLIFKVTD